MGRRRKGERNLGPYRDGRRWHVVLVGADGERILHYFETEGRAKKFRAIAEEQLVRSATTITQALDAYEQHLKEKGNKPKSYRETARRMRLFFSDTDLALDMITPKVAEGCYRRLVDQGYSADTHRNIWAEAKSFLRWCVGKKWLARNALEHVQGIGRRRHGKPQLRLDEARKWLTKTMELAYTGKDGALAAALTLLLGLRASEIIQRQVLDVDDGGRLLWVPDSKTEAGRRTQQVPKIRRPRLRRLAENRPGDELLFGHHYRKWPWY